VDVRSRPYGRIPVFNRNAIQRWLPEAGIRYLWKGDILGGFENNFGEAYYFII
jgi:hypothetical protein